jgi:hypothetical protein
MRTLRSSLIAILMATILAIQYETAAAGGEGEGVSGGSSWTGQGSGYQLVGYGVGSSNNYNGNGGWTTPSNPPPKGGGTTTQLQGTVTSVSGASQQSSQRQSCPLVEYDTKADLKQSRKYC